MRVSRLARVLAWAMLVVSPLSSRAADTGQSAGLWHLSHLSDPVTGKFNYCAVENAFDNGLTLAFARNRDFNTNIVVSFPDKRLDEHSRYKMLVLVDANPARDMDAFSADQTILVLPLQRDRKLLDWLQKGKLLGLKGPQDAVKFSLDGVNDAFHKLQACVEEGLKDESAHVSQPSVGLKSPQVAAAEMAHPIEPDMVQPLPLPSQPVVSNDAAAAAPTVAATNPEPSAVAEAVAAAEAKVKAAPVPDTQPVIAPAPDQPVQPPMIESPSTQPEASIKSPVVSQSVTGPAITPPAPVAPPVPQKMQPSATVAEKTVSAALPGLPDLLASAGVQSDALCSGKSTVCSWRSDKATGSISEVANQKSIIDTMLDDTDAHEKSCSGHFTAENGAPSVRDGLQVAEAVYVCGGMVSTVLYAHGIEKTLVATGNASVSDKAAVLMVRQRIAQSLGTPAHSHT